MKLEFISKLRIMIKSVTVFFLLCILITYDVNSQVKKGTWLQEDVTITYWEQYNPFLYYNASVIAFISNRKGEHNKTGRSVTIINNSSDTIYYKYSANIFNGYVSSRNPEPEFTTTLANIMSYFAVAPDRQRIIDLEFYETALHAKSKMNVKIDFKYFQSDSIKKKSQDDFSKVKPSEQNTVNTSPNPSKPKPIPEKLQISFYVFLTTEYIIDRKQGNLSGLKSPKDLHIISKPILHYGNLTDGFNDDKEQFVQDIDKQLKEKPDDLKAILRNNNFEKITLHYGKPYSTELLKTNEATLEAIEAYKNSTKELLEGLAEFDFFQLK